MSENRVYLLMLLAVLFWSGAYITGKWAVSEFPVFSLTFFRFFIALPFIFAILIKRRPQAVLPEKRQWLPLISLGIIGTFLYHVLFFSSLKYTTATNAALLAATMPMVTAILAGVFGREKIAAIQAAGILLAFGGILLVVTNGNLDIIKDFQFNHGDILMFVAVWSMSVYTILSRVFMNKYQISPITVITYTFLVCSIVSLPFVLWEMSYNYYLPYVTAGGWLSVAYMAIFSSVFAYLFQMMAVQKIGAPKTAIFINLVPVCTIALAVLFLGEPISGYKLACACIVIVGVYLASRPKALGNICASVKYKA